MQYKRMSHIAQIAHVVRSIEVFGYATIAVADTKKETIKFLADISGTYYTYLPEHSTNYVIARSAPNGNPDKSCTIDGLGNHNRHRFT